MEETLQPEPTDSAPVGEPPLEKPVPQGIGMAVAFDWGLAVQLLIMPLLAYFLQNLVSFKPDNLPGLKLGSLPPWAASSLISLPIAALLGIFGEGIRRGWRWTRPVQVIANTLGFVGGIASLGSLWQSSKMGNYWPAVTSIILLIFSPLIAWRLSRPATRKWFATVTSAEARKRHGGTWPWLIALWSVVGGVLQTLAVLRR